MNSDMVMALGYFVLGYGWAYNHLGSHSVPDLFIAEALILLGFYRLFRFRSRK